MITNQEWLGIQFNLEADIGLKDWLKSYRDLSVSKDGEHITVYFSEKELQQSSASSQQKLELIKEALRKGLAKSDYTNIYSYLNADRLAVLKTKLLEGDFQKPIRVEKITEPQSILANLKSSISTKMVLLLIAKNRMTPILDEIFQFLNKRDFAQDQQLSLELSYEDKDEWGSWCDNLNLSIQLEVV